MKIRVDLLNVVVGPSHWILFPYAESVGQDQTAHSLQSDLGSTLSVSGHYLPDFLTKT